MTPKGKIEIGLHVAGMVLFAAGVFLNEWTLKSLFSPDGILSAENRFKILFFDGSCILTGVLLMSFPSWVKHTCRSFLSAVWQRKTALLKLFFFLLPFLLAEITLRAAGCYETYTEKGWGTYVSPYNQLNQTPWVLDSGVKRTYSDDRKEFTFEVRTNSEGVRDIEHPLRKEEHEYRIIGLGDSFTMGIGAPFESTYLKVLERHLQRRSASRRIRSICGGVSGSDPVFSYYLFVKRLIKYRPDLVILLINESDIGDIMTRGGLDRFGDDGIMKRVRAPRLEWLFANFRIVRAVMMVFGGYDYYVLRPGERAERQRKAVECILDVGERLKNLGMKRDFDFVVFAQAFSWNAMEQSEKGFSKRLASAFSEKGISYRDLTDYFVRETAEGQVSDYAWPLDGHYNEKGYALLAAGIEQTLAELFTGEDDPWNARLPVTSELEIR